MHTRLTNADLRTRAPRLAAEVISGLKHYFDPKVIPSIAYTEPEVAWVGLTEKEAKENRLVLFPIRVDEAVMQMSAGWAADVRRMRHIGDFTGWKDHDSYQQAFTRLLRDLKAADEKK